MIENKDLYAMSDTTNIGFEADFIRPEAVRMSEEDNYTGMQITVMSSSEVIGSVWFPKTAAETIYFGRGAEKLYMEARDGQWYAGCIPPAYFQMIDRRGCSIVPLYDKSLYIFRDDGKYYVLYSETTDEDSAVFHNYYVNAGRELRIGRAVSNDLIYPSRSASKEHAVLRRDPAGWWQIRDCGSANGIFVNQKRVRESTLRLGDQVFIVGLRLIIGTDFISVNDGNQRIQVSTGELRRIAPSPLTELPKEQPEENIKDALFSRSPRYRMAVAEKTIQIEAPPMSLNSNKIPLLLRMGGSAVMGGAAAMGGNFLPLISTLLFPTLTQRYTEKEKKEYETRRFAKYTEYLNKKEKEIRIEKEEEQKILNRNYPAIGDILFYADGGEHLWERRPVDDDFLHIRLGSGKLPLIAEIKYPDHRFDMDEDELEDKMYRLAETKRYLEHVPVTFSPIEHFVIGMRGVSSILLKYIEMLLMQMALLHSCDELKLVLLTDNTYLSRIEWVKYLPHFWDDRKTIRFLATELLEAYQISEYLKSQIEEDLPKPRSLEDILAKRPYYMVFVTNRKLLESLELLSDIMRLKKNCGVTIVTVYDTPPKDSSLLLDLQENSGKVIYMNQLEQEDISFEMDAFSDADALESMRKLANVNLKALGESFSLPQSVTFLELYGLGSVEQLQPMKRWRESDPVKSLAVPVGIGTDGGIIYLDLHEKFQGPHGLVAGTTGSGKSEFILTYILSMAINFHPDEVAFVLIDYKGGGLAGAFVDEERGIHLPHVIGTITNLDGSAIARSLISLQSELTRRQAVFNRAKSIANEGTMDIYTYQRLYRRGIVKESMPHLFIISDEFAELKAQEPEFMDQLISIARIGRSLGIHLILATQKPAGVVNDQIRSNSKFKVCLKVQDRADSMDMLKRPEAADLKETGRFYMQVGYNESFVLGQSGWSGAPYEPQEKAMVRKDKSVRFIDTVGQVHYTGNPSVSHTRTDKTQLVAIVEMLAEVAQSLEVNRKMLWKPALEKRIALDDVELPEGGAGSVLPVSIGILDDPENQEQMPFVLDMVRCRHLLIAGEAGSGKTTLLQTILLCLVKKYSPEQLQFYMLDYSGRRFGNFQTLPHCGAVLNEEEESSLDAFFELLNGIVEERRKLFAEMQADSYETANRIRPIPLILAIIDNMAGLAASKKGDEYCRRLQEYLKNSGTYGVKYILTCSHLNEILTRVRQEIGMQISLHQKSKYDYADVLGCRCDYLPPELSGRGLVLFDGRPLEFQAAMFEPETQGSERAGRLREYLREITHFHSGNQGAKRLPSVPEAMSYAEFCQSFSRGRIPLGFSVQDVKPVALPFKQWGMLSLYFGNPIGQIPVLENFLYTARAEHMVVTVLKKKHGSHFEPASDGGIQSEYLQDARIFENTPENLLKLWKEDLFEELKIRKDTADTYCRERGISAAQRRDSQSLYHYMQEHTRPLLVLFEDFSEVCITADEAGAKVLSGFLKQNVLFNLYFIGCFYPGERGAFTASPLYRGFHPDVLVMMFGGQLSGQSLCMLPREVKVSQEVLPYNQCLMKYRDEYYLLVMPCGELLDEVCDEDDMPIFTGKKK